LHEKDNSVLQEDLPEPDEEAEKLAECNVMSRMAKFVLTLLKCHLLSLHPGEDLSQELTWRL